MLTQEITSVVSSIDITDGQVCMHNICLDPSRNIYQEPFYNNYLHNRVYMYTYYVRDLFMDIKDILVVCVNIGLLLWHHKIILTYHTINI